MPNKEALLAEAKDKKIDVPEDATKAQIQTLIDEHDKAGNDDAAERQDKNQQVTVTGEEPDGVERDHTPAGTTEEANAETDAQDRIQPPVAAKGLAADATDEAYDANNQTNPALTPSENKENELKEAQEKEDARKAEVQVVDTKLGSSEEEAAAERAGVPSENLENPKQNREPKNEFEQSNQKVTEEERQAAQEVSDMTTKEREEQAPTPEESAKTDAAKTAETNQGSSIADAIREGLASTKEDKNIRIVGDDSVEPRFAIVKDKETGETMIRENETGVLSKVQLESLEEKEASIQNREVEEL